MLGRIILRKTMGRKLINKPVVIGYVIVPKNATAIVKYIVLPLEHSS
jgi:hypothetical protein